MQTLNKPLIASASAAVMLGLGSQAAVAENPFVAETMPSGYTQLASSQNGEGKYGEGKTDRDKKKHGEGKRGGALNVRWIDHLNMRIPEERVDEFVALYRDSLGLDLEHLEAYRRGEKSFFFLRLTEHSIIHVAPTDSFVPPSHDAFNHVAFFVEETHAVVQERLEESGAEIVDTVDRRLSATGEFPSVYFEDPFGYIIELKSAE